MKEKNYCANQEDRKCPDAAVFILKEADHNHVKECTVAEFLEFCIRQSQSSSSFASDSRRWFEIAGFCVQASCQAVWHLR